MWPKSRAATAIYQPINDAEQQGNDSEQPRESSFFPRAPVPKHFLLGGDNSIKREQLLGGNNKIDRSLLLGGNKPLPDHLLLMPMRADTEDEAQDENDLHENTDFEHLDYLEQTDEMPLTPRAKSKGRMPKVTYKTAIIVATVLVLLLCLMILLLVKG